MIWTATLATVTTRRGPESRLLQMESSKRRRAPIPLAHTAWDRIDLTQLVNAAGLGQFGNWECSNMTSPLVRRLVASIDQCHEPEGRACRVAELACYWARVGEFEEAERLRGELRRDFGDGRSVRVSILIMCIEALLLYFRELSPQARDRMARASLLSTAARESRLIALTSAWMAHIDFNLNRFETMATSLAACLSAIEADDGAAICRVSLVLGDAFLFVRALPASDAWYARAHAAAAKIGDQAAIGALTYNRAALHVAGARLRAINLPLPPSEVKLVLGEVQSAINYQAMARLRSLDHLLHSAKVGVMILQERYAEALPYIANVLTASDVPPNSAERALLQADMALSLARTGQTTLAQETVVSLLGADISSFGADDRAVIWSSVFGASENLGAPDALQRYSAEVGAAINQHNETVARLAALLTPFEHDLTILGLSI